MYLYACRCAENVRKNTLGFREGLKICLLYPYLIFLNEIISIFDCVIKNKCNGILNRMFVHLKIMVNRIIMSSSGLVYQDSIHGIE